MASEFLVEVDGYILECLRDGHMVRLDANGEPTYVKYSLFIVDENRIRVAIVFSDAVLSRLYATVREVRINNVSEKILEVDIGKLHKKIEENIVHKWWQNITTITHEDIVQTILNTIKEEVNK